MGENIKVYPFKQYIAEPKINGKYPVIQQGDNPIVGYSNGEPFYNFEKAVLFGDHTLSLYKPKVPFFVATDGIKILASKENFDENYFYYLLETSKPETEGYKRHFGVLKEKESQISNNKLEQEQIGTLFSNLDNLITLHQRKLEK